jgi:hypothetical protein
MGFPWGLNGFTTALYHRKAVQSPCKHYVFRQEKDATGRVFFIADLPPNQISNHILILILLKAGQGEVI